jgi:uncharacterized protein (DUF433 family)
MQSVRGAGVMAASILGKGIYDYSEAGRLIGVSAQRIAAWFRGRSGGCGPVLDGDYTDELSGHPVISFLDLVEASVVSKLRDHGVSLIGIREAYSALAKDHKTCHPFSHRGLYTDGKRVFLRVAEESGDEQLVDVIERQQLFPRIILPYLKHIDYSEDTQLAARWHIQHGVVIDPEYRFGKPIVEACTLPTSLLAAACNANGRDIDVVADWYGVTTQDVGLAVAFEDRLRQRAA